MYIIPRHRIPAAAVFIICTYIIYIIYMCLTRSVSSGFQKIIIIYGGRLYYNASVSVCVYLGIYAVIGRYIKKRTARSTWGGCHFLCAYTANNVLTYYTHVNPFICRLASIIIISILTATAPASRRYNINNMCIRGNVDI